MINYLVQLKLYLYLICIFVFILNNKSISEAIHVILKIN